MLNWWSLVILLLWSCKSTSVSQQKHDLGEPVEDVSKYSWTQLSSEEFLKVQGINPNEISSKLLPPDAPIAKRIQYWVDKLDSQLRILYPEKLVATPKPLVHIMKKAEPNAFVMPVALCFDNIRFSPDGSIPVNFSASEVWALHEEGYIGVSNLPCNHRTASLKELETHLELITRKNVNCKLTAIPQNGGNFIVSPNAGCQMDASLNSMKVNSPTYNVNFAVVSTSSDFVIYSGSLQHSSEEETLATAFHELKHYYGAHGAVPGKNYLYHIEQENQPTKPIASDDLKAANLASRTAEIQKAQSQAAIDSLKSVMKPSVYSAIDGQKVHTFLSRAITGIALIMHSKYCSNNASYDLQCNVCQQAYDLYLKDYLSYPDFNTFGLIGPITDERKTSYLRLESAAIACLNTVSLSDNPRADRLNEMSLDAFSYYLSLYFFFDTSRLDFPDPMGKLGDYFVSSSEIIRKSGRFDFIAADYAEFAVELAKYKEADSKQQAAIAELQALNEKAKQENLGYYSYEQEADEFALEALALLGLDPRVGIEHEINLISFISGLDQQQACRAQFEKGWPVPIGWGPFADDPHPDQCFRARNADKEIAAHGYPKIAISPASELKPSWTELVDDLNSRLSAMSTIATEGSVIAVAAAQERLLRMNPCLYTKTRRFN